MKYVIYKQFRYILTLMLLSTALWSCTDDRESLEENTATNQSRMVTFSVKVPVTGMPQTYALNTNDENEVSQIAVLLFDATGYTYQPIYSNNITTNPGDSKIKTFTLKVPEGTYDLLILANANNSLNTALGSIDTGDSKASVIAKLVLTNPGKWEANTAAGSYIPIPMWGEITNITIDNTLTGNIPATLVRMLAKIDVTLDAGAQPIFKLKSVRLYNNYNQGQIVPNTTVWNVTPSIPATAVKPATPATTPLVYATMTTADIACANEIYTFEALAGAANTPGTNTCLVIGGTYGTDTNETYYRIDFANTAAATPVYLPLLRNHSYKVNIKQIEASGYATAADAFAAPPFNIKADITVWDDARITKMAYDDQYILGVSNDDFTFTREVRTVSSDNTLSVTTDVPGGWTVAKIVDAADSPVTWLSLSPNTGAAGTTIDTRLILQANAGAVRTGYIHLSAGRLTYVVKVTQTVDAALMLQLRDVTNTTEVTNLVFAASSGVQPAAQTLNLSWMPASETVTASTAQVGSLAFVYGAGDTPGTGAGTAYSDVSGIKSLSIRPTAFTPSAANPFEERISKVDFTVNNGTNYISKSVFLRQLVYSLVVDQTTNFYRLDGSTYTLNVRSNSNWKIKSVTENVTSGTGPLLDLQASDNLRTSTTGGVNTLTGTPVTFRVTNNTLNLQGTLTIVFESTDSPQRFSDVSVVLNLMGEYYPPMHNGWAGSNIYWDGSKLTFDDVNVTTHRNYQGLYFQWGSLWGISPLSNWATSTMLYSPSGTSGTADSFIYGTWSSWPRVSDANITSTPPAGKTVRDRAYLYEITDGTTGIGDICKYMTEKGWAPGSPAQRWRMPTSQEFETASGAYTRSGTWSGVTSNSAQGQYVNANAPGYTKANQGTPFIPAAGYRYYSNGQLVNVGANGYYWSATPLGTYGYTLYFDSSTVLPGTSNASRAYGFSVRCVRE